MHIIAHRHLNLHSPSSKGLIYVDPSPFPHRVPDDVKDVPGFNMLLDSGYLTIVPESSVPKVEADTKPKRKPKGTIDDPLPLDEE